ncbi:LCP family protein [Treponema sp. Marseille-Q4523]|uniref:LCP family protein n=1 Tax=Treponema sp. Marseille-Q4523 TaxID=2810610 RepID=UPI0019600C17|nr:LCP family protein [Treponema sp. Marseille-Q4523]MBM7023688.1 LCP family protein [Treponema sp. Marseille-Q4523]
MHIRDEQKGILFLILIFAIIAGVSIFIAMSLRTDTVGKSLENDQVIRTLYVLDDGDGNALMTEVVIYYPVSKKAAVVNIPYNVGGIYRVLEGVEGTQGRTDGIAVIYREKGIAAYLRQIENLLGTSIPFYSIVKLDDFIRLTDMVGGLRVFISAPVDSLSADGERWLLPSGAVTLDGDKVSTYIRYRLNEETDADVYERYQNIMIAYFTQLGENKAMILAKKNINKFLPLFSSNLDAKDFATHMSLLAEMNTEYIIKQNVTGRVSTVDGKQLLFPLNGGEFIKQAVAQSTNMLISTGNTMTSRIYVLEIQNGTTVQGLAHNTAILFQNASYDILSTLNADRNDYEKTVIIDHIGNREIAKMVGDFIRCTNIQEEEVRSDTANESVASVDFTIILGKDFDGRYVRPSAN